ncbi:MAG TPA: hypothetical protein VGS20_13535 [Candidatus Acidoferrales bacterium]|nr:hypothetical protein [Candidatus Acidoferrales bacterium]
MKRRRRDPASLSPACVPAARPAVLLVLLAALALLAAPRPARAASPGVPPEIQKALDDLYGGNPDAALAAARNYQRAQPDDPLGYLLEGEVRWWTLYCSASEIKWGMVDAWQLPKDSRYQAYLNTTKQAIHLAEAQLKAGESARAHLYAGMGYALEARLYGLRGQSRATARAGVHGRKHLLKALESDPSLADADTGLGLYNYYVDTLSPMVKVLRFFMGIPGGSKRAGIRQLRVAMSRGQLTAVEARFYLAKNLRTYDHQYAQARDLLEPLAKRYPRNPVFLLALGDVEAELGHAAQASAELRRVEQLDIPDAACARRSRELARQLVQATH